MAKATLPTNFQDDIMNDSMGGKRKYNLIQNADGTVSLEDVTAYDQVGSNFGAGQINATNTAVNASADSGKIVDSLTTIAATTQSGYMAGALAVKELNTEVTATKKSVADGKASVASAITSKGVSTAADATFAVMAANIGKISTDVTHSVYAQAYIPNGDDLYIRIYKDGVQICNTHFEHKYGTFTTSAYTI